MQINKESVIPLYYQLADFLREQISKKIIKPGDPLPSETDLVKRLELSRGTIRQAFQILTQERLIIRKPGRGSFVSYPKIERIDGIQIGSFSQAIRKAGEIPSAKIIEARECKAPNKVHEKLKIGHDDNVVLIKRLRLADDLPLAIEEEYFVKELGEKLLKEDLTNSIYSVLKEKFNYSLSKFNATIEVTYADSDKAKLLGIAEKAPVFSITRIVYLSDNKPVEFAVDTYCADRVCFEISEEFKGENPAKFQARPNVKSNNGVE